MAEADTFASLLARARCGEQEAVAQLVQQYEPKVRLVARVLLGLALRPFLDSVDLVQSVHRSLMVGLREDKFAFDTPENLIALALTMVRRKVARQWRHLKRQQRLESGENYSGDLAQVLVSLSSPRDDPAQAVEFADQVEHLCRDMSETERRLLELRVQGYSFAEIAQELGLGDVALRVRLTRLRQRLRTKNVLDDWL